MIGLDQILDGLIRRTTEGKLQWHRSVLDDQFVASVGAISVVIREDIVPSLFPKYRFEVLDESGQTVEILGFDNATVQQENQLKELFVLARRSALDIDSVLQRLADGLGL